MTIGEMLLLCMHREYIMQAKLIQIGNSKGIRIPNHILKSLHISDSLDLIVDETKNEIILKSSIKPRENWDLAFQNMRSQSDDSLIIEDSIDLSSDQWEW